MSDLFHISQVHLSGYRTLKDVSIDFVPGLNIIIGNNGVGKSNFLRFLNSIINIELEEYAALDCGFSWREGRESENWQISQNFKREDEKRFTTNLQFKITNKLGKTSIYNSRESLTSDLSNNPHKWFFSDYLPHVIHTEDRLFLTTPFETSSTGDLFPKYRNIKDLPYYLNALLVNMSFNVFDPQHPYFRGKQKNLEEVVKNLFDFDFFSYILRPICVIQDFRFKPDFEVKVIDKNVEIKNLLFEFLVNQEWIPYKGLSDGTKRLFNIIVDTATKETYMNAKDTWGESVKLSRVLLIEEPELGIHPHQLGKLMRFIRDESEKRQIVVTTHSPDVLDVLGKSDLHRIIIADYDNQKGTQLRHLTEDEKKKATTFLENEAFLSDYWKHSTLEAR